MMEIVIFIIIGILLLIIIEWAIGKAIGNAISSGAGIALGIIFIILFPLFLMGLAIIIYSNKNKNESPYNIHLNINSNGKEIYRNVTPENSKLLNNTKVINIIDHDPNDFYDLLSKNDLHEYIDIFKKNKLTDLKIISELNETDLKNIGVKIMGDRKKMLNLLSAIRTQYL